MSSTYKLIVPANVEAKIRYLIRKYPSTEWSGVLFYSHTGNFEDNNLVLTCEDFLPMDLGTSGWTEFKMNEDVVAYMTEHMNLFYCELGILHSHHRIGAYFSGQDMKRLNEDGDDTNCFLSLVVDTKGEYVAAITRKVKTKVEVVTKSLGTTYEFFGEGPVETGEDYISESTRILERETIQYFLLDVEREVVDNPFEYLDSRFDEIEKRKQEEKVFQPLHNFVYKEDDLTSEITMNTSKAVIPVKEPTLWDKETMDEMVNADNWKPDTKVIHRLVVYLVTCSLIVNDTLDLKQWIVRHMQKKYDDIFSELEFMNWADFMVSFLLDHYSDSFIPEEILEDPDCLRSRVAKAMVVELCKYPSNEYIDHYIAVLDDSIYE